MARYNEQAKILAKIATDKNALKASIAGQAEETQVGKRSSGYLRVIPGALVLKDRSIGDAFIVGHPTNGKIGVGNNGVGGSQITIGTGDLGTQTVQRVINYNKEFTEDFEFNTFEDSSNTTATTNYSSHNITFTTGEVYTSIEIYKDSIDINTIKPYWEGTDTSNLTVELSTDGGTTWTEVESDQTYNVTGGFPFVFPVGLDQLPTGQILKWKVTATGSATITKFKATYT